MSEFETLSGQLTPEVYQSLKRAVELGKWPDGRRLSDEQRSLCLQAVIAYEHKHLPEGERSGYIARKDSTPCASDAKSDDESPLKWQ